MAFYFLLEKRGLEKHWREFLPLQGFKDKRRGGFCPRFHRRLSGGLFPRAGAGGDLRCLMYTIGFLIVGVNYAFLLDLRRCF